MASAKEIVIDNDRLSVTKSSISAYKNMVKSFCEFLGLYVFMYFLVMVIDLGFQALLPVNDPEYDLKWKCMKYVKEHGICDN